MTTNLRAFLRDCPTGPEARATRLQQLSSQYSIAVKRHPRFPELVMLKYSQIDSPMADPIVQECRGTILNENDDWAPVSWPFHKFFNHDESLAAKIDWNSAVVLEKVDGSLIQLYHYAGEWHVATSGTPDAGGSVFDSGMTFAELFWRTFKAQGLSLADLDVPECDDERTGSTRDWTRFTFLFELTTPLNKVVVQHRDSRVTLIGIRDRIRGTEAGVHQGPMKWPKVKAFDLADVETIKATFGTMDPTQQEGYVVVDRNWNRVKIKSPAYVALHHMRGNGNPSPKRALEAILANESREYLSYWPEFTPLFTEVEGRFRQMITCLEIWYEEASWRPRFREMMNLENDPMAANMKPGEAQKIFAEHAIKSPCPSALFTVRAGKATNIDAFLRSLPIDRLAEVLKLKELKALPDAET